MKKYFFLPLSLFVISLMLMPMVVQAFTLDYAGTVTYTFDPNNDLSNFGISLGDNLSVHIEFDEAASPNSIVSGTDYTYAIYNNIISEFRITSGSYTAYASVGDLTVYDAFVSTGQVFDDSIVFSAEHTSTPPPKPGVIDDAIFMNFFGDYDTFSGTSLDLVSPPSTVIWDSIGASIDFSDSGGDNLQIVSEDLRAAPVPEPSTFLLLGGGLAGLAFVARRRRKE